VAVKRSRGTYVWSKTPLIGQERRDGRGLMDDAIVFALQGVKG